MPRPERYVSRSDLGWGVSGASSADPKKGLVIHYDGSNQRLSEKPHSACARYWKQTRRFHTKARGWADIGYCVDEETEILTEDGWKNFREINEGDIVLTLDHETGLSRWQPLLAVNVFPATFRELIRMEGRGHSSLTTAEHRWPVERSHRRTDTRHRETTESGRASTGRARRTQQGRERTWATTETLTHRDRIPLSAPCGSLPTDPKWSDALVELVAWFWTGGHVEPRSGNRLPCTGVVVHQPEKNPENVTRIRGALNTLLGPPCARLPRVGGASDGEPRWREAHNGRLVEFHLSADAGRILLEQAPGRVPGHAFLRSLTRAQLELFIEVSLLGGGRTVPARNGGALVQESKAAAEAFQFAAVLAGRAASLRRCPPTASTGCDTWTVELRSEAYLSPRAAAARESAFAITREPYEGRIWCPTTPNGTWLARRSGTVYFTGNSYGVCPHGYVFEGRGLYRTQAAQPGGNSTYYSVTLMCGPSDEITDAQVNAVRQLREWLMEPRSSISGTVRGHRDFVDTSCPGDKLYRMVRDGVFSKPARWGGASAGEEDTVPHYLNMAQTKEITIPPHKYASLRWDTVWTDTAEIAHKDGLAVISRPCDLNGALWLDLEGLAEGEDVQLRMADWERKAKKYHLHPIAEGVGTAGRTFPAFPVVNRLGEGRTMDLRVYNVGSRPLTLRRATFKGHVWLH